MFDCIYGQATHNNNSNCLKGYWKAHNSVWSPFHYSIIIDDVIQRNAALLMIIILNGRLTLLQLHPCDGGVGDEQATDEQERRVRKICYHFFLYHTALLCVASDTANLLLLQVTMKNKCHRAFILRTHFVLCIVVTSMSDCTAVIFGFVFCSGSLT